MAALLRASEEFDAGEPSVTIEDVESEWMLPDFYPTVDVLLVFDSDRAVACAEVPGWRAEATVHPDARGRGIGTAILGWIERRAVERRQRRLQRSAWGKPSSTPIPTRSRCSFATATHRGTRRGCCASPRRSRSTTGRSRTVLSFVRLIPSCEEEQVYRVVEDAFNEWPHEPSTFEEWQSGVTGRTDFDPTLLFVAATDHEVVGVSFGIPYEDEGWVQQLAVRRDHRNRGLAKALLRRTFDELRRRGSPAVGLSTDSRTGALDLYVDAGMVVRASYTHYSKVLVPGDSGQDRSLRPRNLPDDCTEPALTLAVAARRRQVPFACEMAERDVLPARRMADRRAGARRSRSTSLSATPTPPTGTSSCTSQSSATSVSGCAS